MPLRPSGRRKPCHDFASASDIRGTGVAGRSRVQVERARPFIQIAREVVQVNPGAALDELGRMTDTHAKFYNRVVRANITQSNFVTLCDFFEQSYSPRAITGNLHLISAGVVKQRGDIVTAVDLKSAWGHFTFVIL